MHYEKSEEETDASDGSGSLGEQRRKKRRKLHSKQSSVPPPSLPPQAPLLVPRPPDEEKPVCDECSREFDDSYLLSNFDCQVCDGCR